MPEHRIGTREEWQAAREELLKAENEHAEASEALAKRRQELPWVPVEKEYTFETDAGSKTLPELFDGRSQRLWQFPYVSTYGSDFPFDFGLALTEEQIAEIDEVQEMIDQPPDWLQD